MTELRSQSDTSPLVPATGPLTIVALAAAGVGLLGMFLKPEAFWAGYLVAALYWLGASLGCLGIALIHRTSGGRWGRAIGRQLYAGVGSTFFGLLAVALVAVGSKHLFPWAVHDQAHHDLNHHQQIYFSTPLLLGRFIGFSALWLLTGAALIRRYRQTAGDPNTPVNAGIAPPSLLLFFITTSFFIFDAVLSLTPGWSSSLFPLIQLMSYGITAMAICIIVRTRTLPVQNPDQIRLTHDLGNLLMAFNLLWTYQAFSQYLIMWSGDLPQEVDWYLQRRTPVGGMVSIGLFLFHFVIPFGLLLSRDLKKNPRALAGVALLLMVMCLVDNAWTILPSCHTSQGLAILFMLTNWIGLGAGWILVFNRKYLSLPVSLVPAGGHGHSHASGTAHSAGGAH
ncbi:hypothetical protein [Planctomicrobium sp. SH664]|uniref:hypothetical protein n=1 Tax=Planctomicrobium sp. SH664 TaxID=3448125 RepID=UPI003F5B798C